MVSERWRELIVRRTLIHRTASNLFMHCELWFYKYRLAGLRGILITNVLHGLRGLVAAFGRRGSLQFSEPRRWWTSLSDTNLYST